MSLSCRGSNRFFHFPNGQSAMRALRAFRLTVGGPNIFSFSCLAMADCIRVLAATPVPRGVVFFVFEESGPLP